MQATDNNQIHTPPPTRSVPLLANVRLEMEEGKHPAADVKSLLVASMTELGRMMSWVGTDIEHPKRSRYRAGELANESL